MTTTIEPITRRTVLKVGVATTAAGLGLVPRPARATATLPAPVRALDSRIREGMRRYAIPGVAFGVRYRGRDHLRGLGRARGGRPAPVDADTVFRIGSTTKTFTGTAVMRLVERGRIDLDRPVRAYLPDFRTADPSVAARVTVRQLLNHSAGWLGDYFEDTGQGDDALARYVAGMARLPQLTPPGTVFAYNNAAIWLAGRIIEVVAGKPYEAAVRELVIDPLGLDAQPVLPGRARRLQRRRLARRGRRQAGRRARVLRRCRAACNPAGGLISSARDQLATPASTSATAAARRRHRLLTPRSLRAMRRGPGPGGTLFVELDGAGVTWMAAADAPRARGWSSTAASGPASTPASSWCRTATSPSPC